MGNLFTTEPPLANWDILAIIKVIIAAMIYNRVILLICFSSIFIKTKNIEVQLYYTSISEDRIEVYKKIMQ